MGKLVEKDETIKYLREVYIKKRRKLLNRSIIGIILLFIFGVIVETSFRSGCPNCAECFSGITWFFFLIGLMYMWINIYDIMRSSLGDNE